MSAVIVAVPRYAGSKVDLKHEDFQAERLYVDHKSSFVRSASAVAIAKAVEKMPQSAALAIQLLIKEYQGAAKERLPEYDRFGMLVQASLDLQDPWQARVAQAEALKQLAQNFGSFEVQALFHLLINDHALGDRSEPVRSQMLDVRAEKSR